MFVFVGMTSGQMKEGLGVCFNLKRCVFQCVLVCLVCLCFVVRGVFFFASPYNGIVVVREQVEAAFVEP